MVFGYRVEGSVATQNPKSYNPDSSPKSLHTAGPVLEYGASVVRIGCWSFGAYTLVQV